MIPLRRGIIGVVQTPFDEGGGLDTSSLGALVHDAVAAGIDGFLAPVVASEVHYLDDDERERVMRVVAEGVRGRVPWIAGASSDDVAACHHHASLAAELGASAYLIAVPEELYDAPEEVLPFLQAATAGHALPFLLQDFQLHGDGLDVETIVRLRANLPMLAGIKIETTPAGPKYSAVRAACGADFFIAGGWAVPQMIEALDRGVDAMIPECSMVRVYKAIDRLYRSGDRPSALALFRRLLPVLAFANQDVPTSIAFFKRLLVRKGIFAHARRRHPGFSWDAVNAGVAGELIDLYLALEAEVS